MKRDQASDPRLVMAQIRVVPGDAAANRARATRAVDEAAASGAGMVLLPEAADAGWADPSAPALAATVPDGPFCAALSGAARRNGVWVASGLTERDGDRVFNAAVLIRPDGTVAARHRKIHELDHARTVYAPGDRLGVADTPFGRVGLMICADAFAPGEVISRTLGMMGARLILSPCAWAVPADHDPVREPYGGLWRGCYGPVAREFGLTIAGCSNVGPITGGAWAGRRCIGASLAVGPDGSDLAVGPYGMDAEALVPVAVP